MTREYPPGYRSRPATAISLILLAGVVAASTPAGAITLPAGFTDELVANVGAPTALAFTPDGRLLITTQPGQLRVYQNGALVRSEEHTSELQSLAYLVCRLLLEKKNNI